MFRKFKEKISEEVSKGQQYLDNWVATTQQVAAGFNSDHSTQDVANKTSNNSVVNASESKDLLSFNDAVFDNSQTVLSDSQNDELLNNESENIGSFSLVNLEDDGSPKKTAKTSMSVRTASNSSENPGDDSFTLPSYQYLSSVTSPTVLQSDVESEYDSESQSYSLKSEAISKEQLLNLFMRLREKAMKYRSRYSDAVKTYRNLYDENQKMRKVMVETQDKAVRRLHELKEQCLLEEQAKRHLEENLRVMLEEKDENIRALQTKVEFYKNAEENEKENSETTQLQEKVKRLESVLSRCKETLKVNKEKVASLTKENEELIKFREIADKLKKENESLKQEIEDSSLKLAESKKNLHEELEDRGKDLQHLKERYDNVLQEKLKFEDLLKQSDQKRCEMEEEIKNIVKTSEEDKQNLLQELSRGKAAAIHLIKEESDKKYQSLEKEWKEKFETLLKEKEDIERKVNEIESDITKTQIEETRCQNEQLRLEVNQCKEKLAATIEELNKAEKDRDAEKMDLQKLLTESENYSESLKQEINKLSDRCSAFEDISDRLQQKEVLISNMETKVEEAKNELELVRKQLEEKDRLLSEFSELKSGDEMKEQRCNQLNDQLKEVLLAKEKMENSHQQTVSNYLSEIEALRREVTETRNTSEKFIDELRERLKLAENVKNELIKKHMEEIKSFEEKLLTENRKLLELSTLLKSAETENSELKNLSEAVKSENLQLNDELKLLKSANSERNEKLDLQRRSVEEHLKTTNAELIEITAKLKSAESENSELNSVSEDLKIEISKLKDQLKLSENVVKESISKHQIDRSLIEEELSATKAKLVEVTAKVQSVQNESDQMRSINESLKTEISVLKDELNVSLTNESLIEELKRQIKMLEVKLNEVEKEHSEITEKLREKISLNTKEHNEKLSLLETKAVDQCNEIEQIAQQLQRETQSKIELEVKLTESVKSYTNAIEELKAENNSLKVEISEAQQKSSKVIDSLTTQVEEKNNIIKELKQSQNEHKIVEDRKKIATLEKQLKEALKMNEDKEKSHETVVTNYLREIQNQKTKLEKLESENEATVERLYKQLELREAQLEENLLAIETQQNLNIQELVETKRQLSKLNERIEELEKENEQLKESEKSVQVQFEELKSQTEVRTTSEKNQEDLQKKIDALEMKLREKEAELEECIDKYHSSEDKLIHQYKKDIAALENEITEKNAALEEVHDYYHQRLQEKEEQLKTLHNEFGSSSVNEHSFQVKAMQKSLLQYQDENVRLKELLTIRNNAMANSNSSSIYMPEPTEYEYLRNILFEYMMGREPETLAKVISAVLRFNSEQTEQILRRQELSLANALRP